MSSSSALARLALRWDVSLLRMVRLTSTMLRADSKADDSTRNTRSYGEPPFEHSHDTTSALDEVSEFVTFVQRCLCLAALTLHSISMATLECFRDIGIEAEAMRTGHPETEIGPWYRFSNTVTSGELFKRFAFGTSPLKQVCYKTAVG